MLIRLLKGAWRRHDQAARDTSATLQRADESEAAGRLEAACRGMWHEYCGVARPLLPGA